MLLGISLAVSICGGLALTDDRTGAYVLVALALPIAELTGIFLEGRRPQLRLLCALLAVAAVVGLLWAGWLLVLATVVCCWVLLWTPTRLSARAAPLLLPVAVAVAACAAAVAITFYARPVPSGLNGPAVLVKTPAGQRVAPPSIHVGLVFAGCSKPVRAYFIWNYPTATGPGGSASSQRRRAYDGPLDIVVKTRTRTETLTGPNVNPGEGQTAPNVILPVLQTRGIGSCYVTLPSFLGPWVGGPTGIGKYVSLREADSDLGLGGAQAQTVVGPGPTVTGDPTIWQCTASQQTSQFGIIPECGSVVMLTDSWYQTFQNLMLLIVGALFAVVVSLLGRGITGLGLFGFKPSDSSR
jgi:hypothetical protein